MNSEAIPIHISSTLLRFSSKCTQLESSSSSPYTTSKTSMISSNDLPSNPGQSFDEE